MRDVYDQADRAGAQPAAPEPEREWTDRAALALAVAKTTSREEAIALVAAWDAPQPARRYPTPADRVTAEGARAVATVAAVGGPPRLPPRRRPDTRSAGPLFTRIRGGA